MSVSVCARVCALFVCFIAAERPFLWISPDGQLMENADSLGLPVTRHLKHGHLMSMHQSQTHHEPACITPEKLLKQLL